jgi:hypothetical protein
VLLAALLTALPAGAQVVSIRPSLRQGDVFRLEITRTRENSIRPQQNGRSRTVVDAVVVAATPQGFVVDWKPGETTFDNPQLAQDPLVVGALRAVQDIQFRLTLNTDGEYVGLANEAEVAPRLRSVVDGIVQALVARIPAAQRDAFQSVIDQVLSPSVLIASATREPQIYFGLNGVTQAQGETTEVNVQLPNPLGTGEIPATLQVYMQTVTPETVSLRTTTTYDAAALQRMSETLAQQLGGNITREQLSNLPPITAQDDGSYLFDRTVGLMREISIERRISLGNANRIDSWRLVLLTAPKR